MAEASSGGPANAIPKTDVDPSFYLLEASLADLADAAIAVGGYSLPVHSQLLSLQSGVLRELFRGERESGGHVRRWGRQVLLDGRCCPDCEPQKVAPPTLCSTSPAAALLPPARSLMPGPWCCVSPSVPSP